MPKSLKAKQCRSCTYDSTAIANEPDPARLAWIAGLIEGEGTFVRRRSGGGIVRIQMTDLDVIEKLAEHLPFTPRMWSYTPSVDHHKPSWILGIQRRDDLFWLVQKIHPLLSERRREAAALLIDNFTNPPDLATPSWSYTLSDPPGAAWAAGVVEGEGWIGPPHLEVTSTDLDVLERLAQLAGGGSIGAVKRSRENHRPAHRWQLYRKGLLLPFLDAIRPWMLSRRAGAVDRLISVRVPGLEPGVP
ncbi:LAGLIDADG family homing endonuclease [Micromonospora sp. DT231]|uniref:LAGLIDADG family homing endonuclease n=1 Tax=Micromonospora sp. DT231 TaxID=3416526 RepID=UPI003CE75250